MFYVAKLTKNNGGYSVAFPDIPGCTAEGTDMDEALKMAKDALEDTLEEYLDGRDLPEPSADVDKDKGLYPVFINAKLAKKLLDMYKITSIKTLEKLDELGFFG